MKEKIILALIAQIPALCIAYWQHEEKMYQLERAEIAETDARYTQQALEYVLDR